MAGSVQMYLLAYVIISAVASYIYCYLKGPVTNVRAMNLIEWCLKLFGIFLFYSGTSYLEISFSILMGYLVINYCFSLSKEIKSNPIIDKIS